MTKQPEDLIWRYTSFFSLLHLIETKLFYLNQVGEMEDFFEGKLKGIYFISNTVPGGKSKKNTQVINSSIKQNISKGLITAKNTYISSWTKGEHENYAFWKIFTSPNDGIVIKSTILKVISSLQPSEISWTKIEYLPNNLRKVINPLNINEIINTKLNYYAAENEVRFFLFPSENYNNKESKNKEDYHIYLKCDPKILIEEIRFSPYMESWKIKLLSELIIKLAPFLKNKTMPSEILLKKSRAFI